MDSLLGFCKHRPDVTCVDGPSHAYRKDMISFVVVLKVFLEELVT